MKRSPVGNRKSFSLSVVFIVTSQRFHLSLLVGYVQACRALMIIALLLCLVSIVVSLLGLKCIKIGSASDESKAKIAVTGGIISILAGELGFQVVFRLSAQKPAFHLSFYPSSDLLFVIKDIAALDFSG